MKHQIRAAWLMGYRGLGLLFDPWLLQSPCQCDIKQEREPRAAPDASTNKRACERVNGVTL